MEQRKNTRNNRKGKHLTKEERVVIERMSLGGYPPREIARTLNRHQRTIEREIKRGSVKHLDSELRVKTVYSSDRGQDVYDLNATAKGPELKLGKNRELVEFTRKRIVEHKESPSVVAFRMKEAQIEGAVCAKTLYSYIDEGLIAGVTNETLWEKRLRSNRNKHVLRRRRKTPARRNSIEKRPEEVEKRQEFGHWEIDLIVGPIGSKAALLTLVERKTRNLITKKLADKTNHSVMRALNSIERKCGPALFRKQFKSITADNGCEFLNVDRLQASIASKQKRTAFFYAHPYSSWERGSNENANKIIRRFIAKGRKIENFTQATINTIENWINNYPRKIINFKTAHQLFQNEIKKITA